MRPGAPVLLGVAAIGGVVIAAGVVRRRAAARNQLARWAGALDLVRAFGDVSGLKDEIAVGRSPIRNVALVAAVQALTDRCAAAAATEQPEAVPLADAQKYMRFASAAYGAALARAIRVDPRRRGAVASSKGTLSK